MTRVRVLVVTGLLGMCGSVAAGEEGLFPFVVSYDTPVNATNVSAWLDRPAGVHGFIRAEDGHLRNDAGPTARDSRAVISIGPAYKTLWYEAELR